MSSSSPEKFIMSSDFASLKNDDEVTITVTVPGSQSVAAGDKWTATTDMTAGTKNASLRSQVTASKAPNDTYALPNIYVTRNGTVSGFPSPYSLYAFLTRVSPTTIRATAMILNPYGATLTGEAGSETFTFKVRTFRSPFED